MAIGGITIIEVFKTLADSKLSMVLTGQQGDVMKESMSCAKTIVNLIPKTVKDTIKKDWEEMDLGEFTFIVQSLQTQDGPCWLCNYDCYCININWRSSKKYSCNDR